MSLVRVLMLFSEFRIKYSLILLKACALINWCPVYSSIEEEMALLLHFITIWETTDWMFLRTSAAVLIFLHHIRELFVVCCYTVRWKRVSVGLLRFVSVFSFLCLISQEAASPAMKDLLFQNQSCLLSSPSVAGRTLMSISWGTEAKEISRPQMASSRLPVSASVNQVREPGFSWSRVIRYVKIIPQTHSLRQKNYGKVKARTLIWALFSEENIDAMKIFQQLPIAVKN